MPRLLIVDDHPLFRLALRQALQALYPEAQISEAGDLAEARGVLQRDVAIDLVLLDLHMPGSHGLMGLTSLRSEFPAVAVMMISAHDDPVTIRRALDYGAVGFLPKRADPAELASALQTVLACNIYLPPELAAQVRSAPKDPADQRLAQRLASLTPQQLRVLQSIAAGRLNKQIADELGITERTVKAHVSALFEKLAVRNRTQAGVLMQSLELRDPSASVGVEATGEGSSG